MSTRMAHDGEHIGESGEVWEEFMQGEYAQEVLEAEASKKKPVKTAAYEQFSAEETGGPNKLGEGPTQDEVAIAHPGGGTTTETVTGVSSERSQGAGFSPQYEMQTSPVNAADNGAHTETIVEQQAKDMEVATKQPTGLPNANNGETGALKWAGVRAHLNKVAQVIDRLEKGASNQATTRAQTREAILRMTKLADELDQQGLVEEAAELDQLIEAEVAALEGSTQQEVTAQSANDDITSEMTDDDDLEALVEEIMSEELETA